MPMSVLKKTLVGLAGIFLLVACFQVAPISISLAQNEKAVDRSERLDLQPGRLYVVCSDRRILLPDHVKVLRECAMGTSLRHDGMHKDEPRPCHGPIKMVLRDDGSIEYECVLCHRKWTRNADGKLISGQETH